MIKLEFSFVDPGTKKSSAPNISWKNHFLKNFSELTCSSKNTLWLFVVWRLVKEAGIQTEAAVSGRAVTAERLNYFKLFVVLKRHLQRAVCLTSLLFVTLHYFAELCNFVSWESNQANRGANDCEQHRRDDTQNVGFMQRILTAALCGKAFCPLIDLSVCVLTSAERGWICLNYWDRSASSLTDLKKEEYNRLLFCIFLSVKASTHKLMNCCKRS